MKRFFKYIDEIIQILKDFKKLYHLSVLLQTIEAYNFVRISREQSVAFSENSLDRILLELEAMEDENY